MERHRGVLECQMSRASAQVQWFKGSVELQSGPKYEMVSDGLYRKLIINDVQPEDEDTYTCDAGNVKTSAQFFVEGAGGAALAPPHCACGCWRSSLWDRPSDQPLTHRAIHHHRSRPAGRDCDGARTCLVRMRDLHPLGAAAQVVPGKDSAPGRAHGRHGAGGNGAPADAATNLLHHDWAGALHHWQVALHRTPGGLW